MVYVLIEECSCCPPEIVGIYRKRKDAEEELKLKISCESNKFCRYHIEEYKLM